MKMPTVDERWWKFEETESGYATSDAFLATVAVARGARAISAHITASGKVMIELAPPEACLAALKELQNGQCLVDAVFFSNASCDIHRMIFGLTRN